jgi:hypothetical protein
MPNICEIGNPCEFQSESNLSYNRARYKLYTSRERAEIARGPISPDSIDRALGVFGLGTE